MKNIRLAIIVVNLISWFPCSLESTSFGGAQENSVAGGREKHRINFYGKFTDANDKEFMIENISISGKYKQIPVYMRPKSPDTRPDADTSYLDLAEVREIELKSVDAPIEKFAGREYIEINVISNDKKHTVHTYLVEVTRKIICDEINPAGPIEREIKFEALGKLKIKGYRYRDKSDNDKKERKEEAVFDDDDDDKVSKKMLTPSVGQIVETPKEK